MGVAIGRTDLVERMAREMNTTKKAAEEALRGVLACFEEALTFGEEIRLKGFGKFALSISEGREGRNPQDPTKKVSVPPTVHVRFKAGAELKESVNNIKTVDCMAKNTTDEETKKRLKAWKASHK